MKRKRQPWPKIRKTKNNGVEVWLVDGRLNGQGKRYFFQTKVEAETKAAQLRVTRENEGKVALSIPERLRIEALDAEKRLSVVGATITEAVEYYLKHAKPTGGTKAFTELIEMFLKQKVKDGCRSEYLRIQKSVLGYFSETFGARLVNEIKHVEVSEWLDAQPWTERTRWNRQRDLSGVFNFAVRGGFCAENPMERIEEKKFDEPAPGILTVAQARSLLHTAKADARGLLPFYAIGMFAGLRTAELEKLDWAEVDLEEKTIEVKAEKAKTRARRVVDMSDNLIEWLRPYAAASGPVTPWNYHNASKVVRKKAGITPWPGNALRHSFASYHLKQHQNANLTALQLGHYSTQQLFDSYRELVKAKDAAAFWELRPESALKHPESL